MRAKFSKPAYKIGRNREEVLDKIFNFIFHKKIKHYEKVEGVSYWWLNRFKDLCEKWDFEVYYYDKINYIVECESKAAKYVYRFEKEGVDFQAAKIDFLCDCGYDSFYMLVILDGHNKIYYNKTSVLKEKGKKGPKDNVRMKGELFYRVPLKYCLVKDIGKFI